MNHVSLQALMRKSGHYTGELDGLFGPASRAAVVAMLTSSDPKPLTSQHYRASAKRLGVETRAIKAVVAVESGKSGFHLGKPLILPEPHLFSRATKGRFDASHPQYSYPKWDRTKYPKTQAERYEQLSRMIGLDVDAGFASASYGRFQIIGQNHKACGYNDPMQHALAHACDEEAQLVAFEQFVINTGLLSALRRKDWAAFAKGYNGPAYAKNKYDQRMAAAYMSATE